MAEVLSTVSIVSFVFAGASLIFAVFCFIKFRILVIIGDLSGRTAKKSIAQMRVQNEKSGKKSFAPSFVNANRGKLTEAMRNSGKLSNNSCKLNEEVQRPETGLINENKTDNSDEIGAVTDLLDYKATTVLEKENLDEPLNCEGMNVLKEPIAIETTLSRSEGVKLTMLDEIISIHTDEVI